MFFNTKLVLGLLNLPNVIQSILSTYKSVSLQMHQSAKLHIVVQ